MDLETAAAFGLTFVAGILSKVVADGWTDRRRRRSHERSAVDQQWGRVAVAMPALLEELRTDLSNDSLVREFFVLPDTHVSLGGSSMKRFIYYESEHQDLGGKLAMLENYGYISDVRVQRDTPIYRMTEEFIDLVQRG